MKPILSHEKRLAQQVRVRHQEHQSKYRQYIKDGCSQLYNRTYDLGEDFPDLFMVSFTSFKSYLSLDVLFKLKRKWSRSWFVAWLLFDWQVANVWACCEFLSQTHRTLSTSDSWQFKMTVEWCCGGYVHLLNTVYVFAVFSPTFSCVERLLFVVLDFSECL